MRETYVPRFIYREALVRFFDLATCRRRLSRYVIALLCLPMMVFAADRPPPVEVVMQVVINHVTQDEAVILLREASGQILASTEQLRRWRIRPPSTASRIISGIAYHDVLTLEQVQVSVNETRQTLELTLPAAAFESTRLENPDLPRQSPAESPPGVFLTYDALWQRTPDVSDPLATLEIGAFSRLGSGSSQFFVRGRDRRGIRLESTWSKDFPQQVATLRIGDGISRAADGWGRSLRYGGLRFGTNFATNPGLSILPTQTVSGSAVVPSTVDIFVNNALVTQQQVPSGPFSIGRIPITAGPGTLRVVVTDLLGRESVVEQAIIGSPLLLRPGLDDYSLEIGRLRRNFGTQSNDYGELFSAFTWRRGLGSTFTAEAHLETMERGAMAASIGAATNAGPLGVVSLTAIASDDDSGSGTAYALAVQRPGRHVTAAAVLQYSSPDFWQLGQTSNEKRSRFSGSAVLGVPLGRFGNVNFAYLKRSYHEPQEAPIEIVSLGWSIMMTRHLYGGLSLRRSFGASPGTAAGLFFSLILDPRTSTSTFFERSENSGEPTIGRNITLQRSLPMGSGWGYRARADANDIIEAGASYQNDTTTLTFDVSRQRTVTSTQLGARGSLLWFGQEFFGSRQLNDGFALVRVADRAGVRIYNGNQWVATTDRRGKAIVPRLLPYQQNVISIDDRDLPLDVQIGELSRVAVPQFRAGVLLDFPIESERPAELRVVHADGRPIAAGASVWANDSAREFRVGVDGRVFLTGLQQANLIRIRSGSNQCGLQLVLEPSADPLPDLGTYICREMQP